MAVGKIREILNALSTFVQMLVGKTRDIMNVLQMVVGKLIEIHNLVTEFNRRCLYLIMNKTATYVMYRWIFLFVMAFIYSLRVILLRRFYAITFLLGVHALLNICSFLKPKIDPDLVDDDGGVLPTWSSDEFRPFIRALPEYKLWFQLVVGVCIVLPATFFASFDVIGETDPGLFFLVSWIAFVLGLLGERLVHMIKYRYIPFTADIYRKQRES